MVSDSELEIFFARPPVPKITIRNPSDPLVTVYQICRKQEKHSLPQPNSNCVDSFCEFDVSWRLPCGGRSNFLRGGLLALKKKSGGIRPIAVGFTLRCLVSKCANAFGITELKGFFHPSQLGEAAIHSARR